MGIEIEYSFEQSSNYRFCCEHLNARGPGSASGSYLSKRSSRRILTMKSTVSASAQQTKIYSGRHECRLRGIDNISRQQQPLRTGYTNDHSPVPLFQRLTISKWDSGRNRYTGRELSIAGLDPQVPNIFANPNEQEILNHSFAGNPFAACLVLDGPRRSIVTSGFQIVLLKSEVLTIKRAFPEVWSFTDEQTSARRIFES